MRYSSLAAAACSSAIVIAFVASASLDERIALLSSALRDAGVQTAVRIGEREYFVDRGALRDMPNRLATARILSLAYAKTRAERAPVIALPGADLDRLDNAIDRLAYLQVSLAALQTSRRDARAVRSALYPIEYLRALSSAERDRRRFIASGSAHDQEAYDASQAVALQARHRATRIFTRAFDTIVPSDAHRYGTARTIIDRASMLSALERTVDEERRLASAMYDPYACDAGSCSSLALPHVLLADTRTPETTSSAEAVRAFYADLGYSGAGPIIGLSRSACLDPEVSPAIYLIAPERPVGDTLTSAAIIPLGNVRFLRSEHADAPYLRFFGDRGTAYVPAKELNHYNCPEMTRDVGTIFAIEATRAFALSRADGDAFTQSIVHEADARAFLARELEENAAGAKTGPEDARIIDLALAFARHSAGFEWVVGETTRIEERNVIALAHGAHPELSAPYLFYTRSGFFAFMPAGAGSATVFKPKPAGLDEPYVYFTDFSDDPALRQRALEDMRAYIDLHYE